MITEHPFAAVIRTLGKGRNGSRSMSMTEAKDAMKMILAREVEPEQLGAFLMLLRVKEETSEEIAGFVAAARESISRDQSLSVGIDWPTYAGKRRQNLWFVLSALLLASNGIPVLMHGMGRDDERIYVPEALAAFGISPALSVADAAARIGKSGFAFLPFELLSPEMHRMLELRNILGLRSPIHTVARMLNPFAASVQMVGVFHPNYADTHQGAAALLGDESLAVFKGEGGEAERNPDTVCRVLSAKKGEKSEEEWPALFDIRHLKDEKMDVSALVSLWRGEASDEYGEAAVIATAAIALKAMGRAASSDEALQQARRLWAGRNISYPQTLQGA